MRRSTILAAVAVATFGALGVAACGGEAPPPQPPSLPVAAASAAAPSPTTAPPPPAKPPLSDLIPQTLKGIGDAFNAHDAQKMAGYYADDAAVYTYGGGETHSRGDLQNSIA